MPKIPFLRKKQKKKQKNQKQKQKVKIKTIIKIINALDSAMAWQ
jgi:hypothetical protein